MEHTDVRAPMNPREGSSPASHVPAMNERAQSGLRAAVWALVVQSALAFALLLFSCWLQHVSPLDPFRPGHARSQEGDLLFAWGASAASGAGTLRLGTTLVLAMGAWRFARATSASRVRGVRAVAAGLLALACATQVLGEVRGLEVFAGLANSYDLADPSMNSAVSRQLDLGRLAALEIFARAAGLWALLAATRAIARSPGVALYACASASVAMAAVASGLLLRHPPTVPVPDLRVWLHTIAEAAQAGLLAWVLTRAAAARLSPECARDQAPYRGVHADAPPPPPADWSRAADGLAMFHTAFQTRIFALFFAAVLLMFNATSNTQRAWLVGIAGALTLAATLAKLRALFDYAEQPATSAGRATAAIGIALVAVPLALELQAYNALSAPSGSSYSTVERLVGRLALCALVAHVIGLLGKAALLRSLGSAARALGREHLSDTFERLSRLVALIVCATLALGVYAVVGRHRPTGWAALGLLGMAGLDMAVMMAFIGRVALARDVLASTSRLQRRGPSP